MEKNLAKAFIKAQSEFGAVVKGSDNPFYKSKYADINDVIKTIKEALNNNDIAYLQPTKCIEVAGTKVNVVETILMHESGESISAQTEIICDKVDAQKFGAAVTYARRFGLQSIVGLPAEDDDGNTASGKVKPTAKTLPNKSKPSVDSKVKKPSEVASKTSSKWT